MGRFEDLIKQAIQAITDIRVEENKFMQFVMSCNIGPGDKILEVGCGFGNKLKLVMGLGLNIIGVEINPTIVEENKREGLVCLTSEEFNELNEHYDLMIMSHIIEHFTPSDLIKFMDNYLDRLKNNGYLIIITPLLSKLFYDDYDHIKPYQPKGISMVFGKGNAQVQYYARNSLELIDIWFRREPFMVNYYAGVYLKKYSRFPKLVNIVLALIYRISFGLIGRTNGWMGLYKKISG
jgi:SAM-dependent methyltransferase